MCFIHFNLFIYKLLNNCCSNWLFSIFIKLLNSLVFFFMEIFVLQVLVELTYFLTRITKKLLNCVKCIEMQFMPIEFYVY